MTALILVRHGESEWNARGLLSGWGDPALTARGRAQARHAGRTIAAAGLHVDIAHTSLLTRAQLTAALALQASDNADVDVHTHWRLNERHLGALEGLDKAGVVERWGNSQRRRWRDDPTATPPPLDPGDPRHPQHQRRYQHVPTGDLPAAERRSDLTRRVLAEWHETITADLRAGRNVLVVAHLGTLRAIIAHLQNRSHDPPRQLDIDQARPVVYDIDSRRPCRNLGGTQAHPPNLRASRPGAPVAGRPLIDTDERRPVDKLALARPPPNPQP
jgi:2,3-bisphosphoglycerate-dependent phosphoglycerate mutase